jgi:hypothetical protein
MSIAGAMHQQSPNTSVVFDVVLIFISTFIAAMQAGLS